MKSEEILPKEGRYLNELTNVSDVEIDKWLKDYDNALNAAEEEISTLRKGAEERYEAAVEDVRRNNIFLPAVDKSLKIAAGLITINTDKPFAMTKLPDDLFQRLHNALPDDCILGYTEIKFCSHRNSDGNECKKCSNYK